MHFPLGYIRQPRVVGEVLGGIILGPSVIGRIPGFTDTVFPKESIPNLSNVANLGLILFLFIIGLEVDMRVFFSNWKIAVSVAAAGMTFPFALGCAIAHGLYHQFSSEPGTVPVAYGTFVSFESYHVSEDYSNRAPASVHRCRHVYHSFPSSLPYPDGAETSGNSRRHDYSRIRCW
jgi:Kef-type K+ transport system membrane component KefB